MIGNHFTEYSIARIHRRLFNAVCATVSAFLFAIGAASCAETVVDAAASQQDAPPKLTLEDLAIFNSDAPAVSAEKKQAIADLIKEETGLVKARPMPEKEKRKLKKAFDKGRASKYTVQELIDAGVFIFKPIANVHPNCICFKAEDDCSIRKRDGKALEVDNATWGKQNIPAILIYGVMHSTEDGDAGASKTIDYWNTDCSKGKRSSSTPFVVGFCREGREIYVTADFESRWQRHCSSKLTGIEPIVNWNSIGVEAAHDTEKKMDYTDAEMLNLARLWTYIKQRGNIPDSKIYTHGELQGHLPKDHVSFRSDPEGFDWTRFGKDMIALRKSSGLKPPVDPKDAKLEKKSLPLKALEDAAK